MPVLELGNAKVADLCASIPAQKHIGRLQVPAGAHSRLRAEYATVSRSLYQQQLAGDVSVSSKTWVCSGRHHLWRICG